MHKTVISLTADAYYKDNDCSSLVDNIYFVKSQRSGNKAMQCGFSQDEAHNLKSTTGEATWILECINY